MTSAANILAKIMANSKIPSRLAQESAYEMPYVIPPEVPFYFWIDELPDAAPACSMTWNMLFLDPGLKVWAEDHLEYPPWIEACECPENHDLSRFALCFLSEQDMLLYKLTFFG